MMEISCERETGARAWESIRSTTVSKMTTLLAYRSSSVTTTTKYLCGSTEEPEAHAARGACRLKIIFVQSSTHGQSKWVPRCPMSPRLSSKLIWAKLGLWEGQAASIRSTMNTRPSSHSLVSSHTSLTILRWPSEPTKTIATWRLSAYLSALKISIFHR